MEIRTTRKSVTLKATPAEVLLLKMALYAYSGKMTDESTVIATNAAQLGDKLAASIQKREGK